MWTNLVQSLNHSSALQEESDTLFSTQDRGIFSVSEELENSNEMENGSTKSRLTGYFCSDIVFSLTYRSVIEVEIKILEKV